MINRISKTQEIRNVRPVSSLSMTNKYSSKYAETNQDKLFKRDSYEPSLISEEILKSEDDFIYEDYIINLISSENKNFKNVYNELKNVEYIDLPMAVEQVANKLTSACEIRKMYVVYNDVYSLLFNYHKKELATNLFRKEVIDLNITDDKILKIYGKIEKHGKYNLKIALEEVKDFRRVVDVLSA